MKKLLLPRLPLDDTEELLRRVLTALENEEFFDMPSGGVIAFEKKTGSGLPPDGWVEVVGMTAPGGNSDYIWITQSTSQEQP